MTSNFNQLSDAQTELLAILAEECGECVQVIGKTLRHGYDCSNPLIENSKMNRQLLEHEIGDIFAAVTLIVDTNQLSEDNIRAHSKEKLKKIQRWLHHNTSNY
jgi:NTP pyrophosphatase (non-canonical NTP hydrolase)